jgi:hypothetical protein
MEGGSGIFENPPSCPAPLLSPASTPSGLTSLAASSALALMHLSWKPSEFSPRSRRWLSCPTSSLDPPLFAFGVLCQVQHYLSWMQMLQTLDAPTQIERMLPPSALPSLFAVRLLPSPQDLFHISGAGRATPSSAANGASGLVCPCSAPFGGVLSQRSAALRPLSSRDLHLSSTCLDTPRAPPSFGAHVLAVDGCLCCFSLGPLGHDPLVTSLMTPVSFRRLKRTSSTACSHSLLDPSALTGDLTDAQRQLPLYPLVTFRMSVDHMTMTRRLPWPPGP